MTDAASVSSTGSRTLRDPETRPPPSSGFPSIDKYELIEEIGHGGMATVYRARDPRLGREVAVKVIHKHLRENVEVGARFLAEARASAKLHHPGIVEVFDVSSEADTERYIVAELIRGVTLRKLLTQHRDMPAEVAASIVRTLCDALEHAHDASIIHRDIKPENVLVELPRDRLVPSSGRGTREHHVDDEDSVSDAVKAPAAALDDKPSAPSIGETQRSPREEVLPQATRSPKKRRERAAQAQKQRAPDRHVIIKIADFGIAKILDAQGVTSTGQVLGSPAHMAPEQIEGGDVDARTDVFALGVLFYECLVGHLPFEGKNPAQVLRKVLEGIFPPADRERPSVGGRWAAIVARALARDADARTPSPGQLGKEIEQELTALGVRNPNALIEEYFEHPSDLTERHHAALVPLLLSRGESAKRRGDITGAAADFNRALALAPNDLTILKRITTLNTSNARRIALRRALTIACASAALGAAAYGSARVLRSHAPPPIASSPAPPIDDETGEVPPPDVEPSATAAPTEVSTAEPTARRIPRVPATPAIATAVAPGPTERRVRFLVSPTGGRLTLDGRPLEWFNRTHVLSVGAHQARVELDPSPCCKPLSSTIRVTAPPADNPGEELLIPLRMDLHPATVTLTDGPPGGQLSCSSVALSLAPGGRAQVKLKDASESVPCMFTSDKPPRKKTVTLRAGEQNRIAWPKD